MFNPLFLALYLAIISFLFKPVINYQLLHDDSSRALLLKVPAKYCNFIYLPRSEKHFKLRTRPKTSKHPIQHGLHQETILGDVKRWRRYYIERSSSSLYFSDHNIQHNKTERPRTEFQDGVTLNVG